MSDLDIKWHDREVLAHISGTLVNNLEKAGEFAAERARGLVPVRTGLLKKSIAHTVEAKGETVSARIGILRKTKAFYGLFVEKGTKQKPSKYMPKAQRTKRAHGATKAQPFLRPAVFDNQKQIERIVRGK